jgi:hypothetical protein
MYSCILSITRTPSHNLLDDAVSDGIVTRHNRWLCSINPISHVGEAVSVTFPNEMVYIVFPGLSSASQSDSQSSSRRFSEWLASRLMCYLAQSALPVRLV